VIKKIKNAAETAKTWCGQEIQPGAYYQIQTAEESRWANDSTLLVDIANVVAVVNDGTSDITNVNDAINYLKSNIPTSVEISAYEVEPPPFAQPTYRTKKDATASKVTVAPGESESADFLLTAERYVSGGTLIVKNGGFEDYVTAEVYDTDGVIPSPYRATLCENWPTVALYIVKSWLEYEGNTYTAHRIDTRPLNAKITAGLYLRVTYYAANDSGSNREVLINYDLTKKL
jgi:hypothetical protein